MCGRLLCGPGHFYGFWTGLLWIAVFAASIALVAWAVARLVHDHGFGGRPVPPPPPGPAGGWANPMDDALNVARLRYARGELDRDQYFRVVEDLTGQRPPAGPETAYPPPAAPPYPASAYPEPPAAPAAPAAASAPGDAPSDPPTEPPAGPPLAG